MTVRKRSTTVLAWLISLVNPPPRDSMTRLQKVSRVFLFTMALMMLCIICSMAASVGIYILQRGHQMLLGFPMLVDDVAIIGASMIINTICVLVLLKIKSADQKLFPPPDDVPAAPKPIDRKKTSSDV